MTKTRRRSYRPRASIFSRWWVRLAIRLALIGGFIFGLAFAYLDIRVRHEFESHQWELAAKLYARPLEIYVGSLLTSNDLKAELQQLGYSLTGSLKNPGTARIKGNVFKIHSREFVFWDGKQEAKRFKLTIDNNQVTSLQDDEDKPLDLARLDPVVIGGIYPAQKNEDRDLVRVSEVPPLLINTLIATEDRDFYEHHGVSPKGIVRAMAVNLACRCKKQGASTITQQLVKNFFLSRERTLARKVKEAMMSLSLEIHYSKDQILEAYLNEIYLGQDGDRAIHGFGLASQFFFGRPIGELELHQAALLVGMVKGPSFYDPRRNPARALERRNVILDSLAEQNIITPQELTEAKTKDLDLAATFKTKRSIYPAYIDLVKRQLQSEYAEKELTTKGLRIFTSMDPLIQRQAERSVESSLKNIETNFRMKKPLQSAVVVTDVNTGEVLALVSDRNTNFAGFDRALDAARPIGSLIKPVVYLAALQTGKYTLVSPLDDSPVSISIPGQPNWQPKNYDRKDHGQVALFDALAHSYNQATVRLGLDVGLDEVIDTMHRLGVNENIPAYNSILLGTTELTPIEVTQMYQTIASGGFKTPLRAIRHVLTADDQPLARYPLQVEQTIDVNAVQLLQYAMQAVVREGTAASAYKTLPTTLNIAGKTGTTDDSKDSWFAGFTGDKLTVVWVGRDDNTGMGLTGATGALPVWVDLMKSIPLQPLMANKALAGIQYQWADVNNGLLSAQGCAGAREVPFLAGTVPTLASPACAGATSSVQQEPNSVAP